MLSFIIKLCRAGFIQKFRWGFLTAAVVALGAWIWTAALNPIASDSVTPGASRPFFHTVTKVIERGSSAYRALAEAGIAAPVILKLVHAAAPVKDLAAVPPGTPLAIQWKAEGGVGHPDRISLRLDPLSALVLEKEKEGDWRARMRQFPTTVRVEGFEGVVQSSFWESATEQNMAPKTVVEMAEIFASLVDFGREMQPGDRWRVAVERLFVEGEPIGWGRPVAAEVMISGTRYTATYFEAGESISGYFAPDGSSLKRMFLKSPLKFGRVTSRFSRNRFHPILKIRRPHLGVDYGAPTGTPVLSVGDGVVTRVFRSRGGGKTIKIRHDSTYQTAYLHLSRFAKGLRTGARVKMGQVIGYVGRTGLATAPHLHFEFYKHGKYVDPLAVKFPPANPLPEKYHAELAENWRKYGAHLPPWPDLVSR